MFENITKGVWSIDEDEIQLNEYGVIEIPLRVNGIESSFNDIVVYEPDGKTVNAEFIAFAFNLQQRFDISKLEEAVELLEKLIDNNMCSVSGDDLIKQLLTQIKK